MSAPDLNLIRAFVAVYETGSVTAAAEVLHLSQPSVTHALGRLRRQLNDDLFLRSRSGMTPTAAARRMYPALVEALNRVEALFASCDNFDPKARTTFRIALSDAGEVSLLPPIAAALHERAPGVTLEIASLDVEIVEGQLMRGELDAFLSSAEFGSRMRATLHRSALPRVADGVRRHRAALHRRGVQHPLRGAQRRSAVAALPSGDRLLLAPSLIAYDRSGVAARDDLRDPHTALRTIRREHNTHDVAPSSWRQKAATGCVEHDVLVSACSWTPT